MSSPIIEQIAVKIKAAVEGVTIAKGCNVDVSEVLRPRLVGIPADPKHWGVVLRQIEDDRTSAEGIGGNPPGIDKIQVFTLDLALRIPEGDETPFDTLANIFEADVTKAVMADVYWDGLATDTAMLPTEFMISQDGTFEGKTLFLEVQYRIAENDPYSKP